MTRPRLRGAVLLPGMLAALLCFAADQPAVHVQSMDAVGPRSMEQQTRSAIVRDYLQAWQAFDSAMAQSQPALLDASFVGEANNRLADTIQEQRQLGIHTTYRDASHNIRVVFYSPEGLSIQLLDNVEYDVEIRGGEQSLGSHHVSTHYIVVMTPAESKWKVRIFQGGAS